MADSFSPMYEICDSPSSLPYLLRKRFSKCVYCGPCAAIYCRYTVLLGAAEVYFTYKPGILQTKLRFLPTLADIKKKCKTEPILSVLSNISRLLFLSSSLMQLTSEALVSVCCSDEDPRLDPSEISLFRMLSQYFSIKIVVISGNSRWVCVPKNERSVPVVHVYLADRETHERGYFLLHDAQISKDLAGVARKQAKNRGKWADCESPIRVNPPKLRTEERNRGMRIMHELINVLDTIRGPLETLDPEDEWLRRGASSNLSFFQSSKVRLLQSISGLDPSDQLHASELISSLTTSLIYKITSVGTLMDYKSASISTSDKESTMATGSQEKCQACSSLKSQLDFEPENSLCSACAKIPKFKCQICGFVIIQTKFDLDNCICLRCAHTCVYCLGVDWRVVSRSSTRCTGHRLCENCAREQQSRKRCMMCEVCQICGREANRSAMKSCKDGKVTCMDCVISKADAMKCGVCHEVLDEFTTNQLHKFCYWFSISAAITTFHKKVATESYDICPNCTEIVSILDFEGKKLKKVQCPCCDKKLSLGPSRD